MAVGATRIMPRRSGHQGPDADWIRSAPVQWPNRLPNDGIEALSARLLLAERAEVSIDTQYYLVKTDNASMAFIHALLRAADRGVRVRLLIDDVFGELDVARRNALLAYLPDNAQKLITTTHLDWAEGTPLKGEMTVFRINNGKLEG